MTNTYIFFIVYDFSHNPQRIKYITIRHHIVVLIYHRFVVTQLVRFMANNIFSLFP